MSELPEKISSKECIKKIYFNRIICFFLIIYFICNLIILRIYSTNLNTFALNIKLFYFSEFQNTFPSKILSSKFDCNSSTTIKTCGLDYLLFIPLILFTEIITIWLIISNRKNIQKRFLILFIILQQLFPITTYIIYTLTPDKVLLNLALQANKDISNTVKLLNDSDRRQDANILDSTVKIKDKIEKESMIPKLIESHTEEEAIFQTLGISKNSIDTFYKAIVIPFQTYSPNNKTLKQKLTFDVLLFPSNILMIRSFNRELIEQLMPVLSEKILKSDYGRYIGNKENKYQF